MARKLQRALRYSNSDIQVVKLITSGAYGRVYAGKKEGNFLALKQVLYYKLSLVQQARLAVAKRLNLSVSDELKISENTFIGTKMALEREIEVLKLSQSEYVLEIYSSFALPRLNSYVIVSELCMCSTEELRVDPFCVPREDPMPFEVVARLVLPIYSAVAFIHSKNLIHKDIKPGNILITYDGVPKLADFGLCVFAGEDGFLDTGYYGTQETVSPEFLEEKKYSNKIDAFALAATFLLLYQGGRLGPKYSERTVESVLHVGKDHEYRHSLLHNSCGLFQEEYYVQSEEYGPECRDVFAFARRTLIWDAERRPSVIEVLNDVFLEENLAPWSQQNSERFQLRKSALFEIVSRKGIELSPEHEFFVEGNTKQTMASQCFSATSRRLQRISTYLNDFQAKLF